MTADREARVRQYMSEIERDPRVSEHTLESLMRAKVDREIRREHRRVEVADLAERAGISGADAWEAIERRTAAETTTRRRNALRRADAVLSGRSGGGPPPEADGLTIEAIRAALDGWRGEWPPRQDVLGDIALGGISDRRIRYVVRDARPTTSWRRELAESEKRRGKAEPT